MKKITTLFIALAAMIVGAVNASAAIDDFSLLKELYGRADVQNIGKTPTAGVLVPVQAAVQFSPQSVLKAPEAALKPAKAPKSRVIAESQLKQDYVGIYTTLITSRGSNGESMKLVKEDGAYKIQNFWNGKTVTVDINFTTGAVTIPPQELYKHETYGPIKLAKVNKDGTPDYTTGLSGTLDDNGVFNLQESWWAAFIIEGENAGKFLAAYYNTVLKPANAKIEYVEEAADGTKTNLSYNLRVDQTSANELTIMNVYNYGLEVKAELTRDRKVVFTKQLGAEVYTGSQMGYFYLASLTVNDEGKATAYNMKLSSTEAAPENNTTFSIEGYWTAIDPSLGYLNKRLGAKFTLDTPIKYPALSVSDFQGSGTEADPYLLSSVDHLILLADKVNKNTDKPEGYQVAMAYLGKHFAITSDLDLGKMNVEAIGNDYNVRFGGHIDGRGHTIKGLYVANRSYNALFGFCDDSTTIKNLTFDSPVIEGEYGCAPIFYCGNLINVHSINPQINNTGIIAGGVAGVVMKGADNCSVKNGLIYTAAYGGGAISEAHGPCSNIHVEGTTIIVQNSSSNTTYPSGGVISNMFSDGDNLTFSGIVRRGPAANYGSMFGGVCGRLLKGKLTNSFAAGTIAGHIDSDAIGGVVGYLAGSLENCYSAGRVHSPSKKSGGIAGYAVKYNLVSGGEYYNPVVRNCYTSVSLYAESYQYNPEDCREVIGTIEPSTEAVLENIYYDKLVGTYFSTRFGSTTPELTSAAGPKGFSSEVWQFTEGYYPRLKASADSEAAKYSATALMLKDGDTYGKISVDTKINTLGENTKVLILKDGNLGTQGYYSKIENGMLKVGEDFGTDTLYITNGNAQSYRFAGISPIPFEGSGTEAKPYLIKTKGDMIKLSEMTTQHRQTMAGVHFALANDIDMELDGDFDGICADPKDAYCEFEGVFDGKGHTIHRLTFGKRLVWSTPPTETTLGTLNTSLCRGWSGLFGRIGTQGVVKNINVAADSKLEMFAHCAAIAGVVAGRVENCRNYADITGYSCWVSGIASDVDVTGVVTDCYNAGTIRSSYNCIGGIAGRNVGTISNCVNTGTIILEKLCTNFGTAMANAGGITGSMSKGKVDNCVNYAPVIIWPKGEYKGTKTGGISSAATYADDKITNCISVGNVFNNEPTTVGAISGEYKDGVMTGVYYDSQVINPKACSNNDVAGVTAATTELLTSGKALEGYDASLWDFTAGKYPTLKQFAAEPKVMTAREPMLTFGANNSVGDVKADITLNAKATWTLQEGTAFTLEGNKVKAPAKVTALVEQLLEGNTGDGFDIRVKLCAIPLIPVSGTGTEADPYLIKTTEEWNGLSAYIAASANTFEGKYIKLASDLDFSTETEATLPLYSDGFTAFNGIFEGSNHTIKGVKTVQQAASTGSLFGILGENGILRNFTLEGTHTSTFANSAPLLDKMWGKLLNITVKTALTTTKTNSSGVVTVANGGSVLEKVTFAGSISSAETNLAGLVGQSTAGAIELKDCVFEGKISSTKTSTAAFNIYAGGLVNSAQGITFTNCTSRGEINLTNKDKSKFAAGFLANNAGTADAPNYIFKNCVNETNIAAGGCVSGFAVGPTSSTNAPKNIFTFVDCENKADIMSLSTAAISSAPTAGFLCNLTPSTTFTRCKNSGDIMSSKNVYAAGFTGYYYGTPAAGTEVTFTDCHNTGMITNLVNQAAGISGYVTGMVKFENCSNSGAVNAQQMAGGIVCGMAGTGPQVINCYNTGDITTTQYRSGGIVSWGAPTNAFIKGCWNAGTVSSTSTIATTAATSASRIGGIAGETSATVENCYNLGTVKGLHTVAGIVASTTKDKTQILSCYNLGKIDCPQDTCGSIIGVSVLNNPKIWTSLNKIENCYYVNENTCARDADTGAKAVSRKQLAALDMGEGYVSIDNYTHPVAKAFAEHEAAVFHAADVIFDKEDHIGKVTCNFNVGGAGKVTWSSDCAALSFNGNKAEFTDNFKGEIILTAKAGELVKAYTLTADVTASSGIDDLENGKEVQARRYYNTGGVEISAPQAGQTVIVVTTYTDGTTAVKKVVKK